MIFLNYSIGNMNYTNQIKNVAKAISQLADKVENLNVASEESNENYGSGIAFRKRRIAGNIKFIK